jgi:hypothetical protein
VRHLIHLIVFANFSFVLLPCSITLFSSLQNIENELSGILEVLLLHNTGFALLPSESSTSSSNDDYNDYDNDVTQYERNRMALQSLIEEDLAHRVGLEEHKKSCRRQLQELKLMLKEISKTKQKEKEKEKERDMDNSGPGSASVQRTSSAVISVFADILLHVRNDLTETWGPLEEDQRALFAAVKSDYRKVCFVQLGCLLLAGLIKHRKGIFPSSLSLSLPLYLSPSLANLLSPFLSTHLSPFLSPFLSRFPSLLDLCYAQR